MMFAKKRFECFNSSVTDAFPITSPIAIPVTFPIGFSIPCGFES